MVAEYLDTGDLRSLRLSSRSLRDCFLFTFVKRYFRVRRHLMTLDSLACLVAISQHGLFGRAMHTLAVTDSVVHGSLHGTDKATAERDLIHESGLAALYLTEVFKNAVNCQTVSIDTSAVEPTSYWGAAALDRETRQSGRWYRAPIHYRMGIRQSIIVALTESGASITTLGIAIGAVDAQTNWETAETTQFPKAYPDNRLTQSRWAKTLTKLDLDINFGPALHDMAPSREFINLFPQLEDLYLHCAPWVWSRSTVRGRLAEVHELVEGSYSPRLRKLCIEGFKIQLDDLMALLDTHRNTLQKVELSLVAVYAPNRDPWQRLLAMVRECLAGVESLSVGECYAVHMSDGFPGATGSDTIREIHFERPDGQLSSAGQVLDNERSSFDRLIQGLRENEPGPEVIDEIMEWGSQMDESEDGGEEEG